MSKSKCCSLVNCVSSMVKYLIAFVFLCCFFNFEKISNVSINSTKVISYAISNKKNEALDSLFLVCKSELKNHINKFKEDRMKHFSNFNAYADKVIKGKNSRTKTIIDCLEKIFTLSKDIQGFTLRTFKEKMEKFLNSRDFDIKLSKFHLPTESKNHSVEDIKKALYMMLDVTNSRDFAKIKKLKTHDKPGEKRFLKNSFVKDSIELSTGISGDEIFNSEHLENEPELQKMLQDAIKKML